MPSGTNTAVVYTPRFYPTLSSVVNEDEIPDILGFIKDGLFLILNKIHYKDLQYNKSINGDAAVIANIATPVAEVLVHIKNGYSVPYNGSPLIAPATSDLLEYYEISAPDADLFGNADAMGLFVAYKKLKDNQNLKLSDVLRLYYKDENPKGLTVDSTITKYTVNYRWFLVAEYFELLEDQENDTYKWLPNDTDWVSFVVDYDNEPVAVNNPPSPTDEIKRIKYGIYRRMMDFVIYWYNRHENFKYTGAVSVFNIPPFIPSGPSPGPIIIGEKINLTNSEKTIAKQDIVTVLENVFFPYLKNFVQNEIQLI